MRFGQARRSGRRASIVVVAILLSLGGAGALTPAPVASAAGRMTHRVTISGELANHWTVNDDKDCGPTGDGTLTVRFRTSSATRVLPRVANDAGRKWGVFVPYGPRAVTEMGDAKATGTATRVDNTTPRPSRYPGETCAPLDKSGCGTAPLKTFASVRGYDRRRISVRVPSEPFEYGHDCLIGDASLWSGPQRLLGGDSEGVLLVRMPKPSALKRRRVVRVTGRTHQRSSYGGADEGSSTNDITRKVTVTFKRLKR